MEDQEQQSAGNPQTGIDVDALVRELESDIRAVASSSYTARGHDPPRCLISYVNEKTHLVDPSEYKPESVRIGPYHHDPFHSTELEKQSILRRLLPDEEERAAKMKDWLTEMAGVVELARGFYADDTEGMTNEEFTRMLLLDDCYVLDFFGVANRGGTSGGATAAGGSLFSYTAIVRDVVYLIENQMPFFVLERIHKLIHGTAPGDGGSTVIDAVKKQIRWLLEEQGYSTLDVVTSPPPCHLVHFLHMHFMPTAVAPIKRRQRGGGAGGGVNGGGGSTDATGGKSGSPAVHRWRLATQYEIAGVKFERRGLHAGEHARSVLDVELRGQTLRVPSLTVDNNTWRILRNLMALEQHSPNVGSHVTAYCLFMSQMASTKKDVALLAKKEIIVHLMGSDEDVAKGFANLCGGVAIDLLDSRRNYLSETMQELERQYRGRRYNWIAWLRRNHLSNPWLVIALVAAIIGFTSGIFQTVYTILGYYDSKKDTHMNS